MRMTYLRFRRQYDFKITQEQLSKFTGVPQTLISQIEKRKITTPRLKHLEALADTLKVHPPEKLLEVVMLEYSCKFEK